MKYPRQLILVTTVLLASCDSSSTNTETTSSTGSTSSSSSTSTSSSTSSSSSSSGDGPLSKCPAPSDVTSCNSMTGLDAPLADCTAASPCGTITAALPPPNCATTSTKRPKYDDNPPRAFIDDFSGATRYACVFAPADAMTKPRPLVLFFHGSHGDADDMYNATLLRDKAASSALLGGTNGFVVASVQGRNTHWVGPNPAGSHHDYYYRDLSSPSCNPDIRNADTIVDSLVKEGIVDPSRIYVTGWSNGGFFASMYAITRHEQATPGGNKIAAAVAYAGADPFTNIDDKTTPSCRLVPYPKSNVSIQLFHRACDSIVACDSAHHIAGTDVGYDVESWSAALSAQVGATVDDFIIAANGSAKAQSCDLDCAYAIGSLAHIRWPDGIADGSNIDYEPDILTFLNDHVLAP